MDGAAWREVDWQPYKNARQCWVLVIGFRSEFFMLAISVRIECRKVHVRVDALGMIWLPAAW